MGAGRPFLDDFDINDLKSARPIDYEHTPNPLVESLGNVFSVLPNRQAYEAQQKTLTNFTTKQQALLHKIRWADFDDMGRFQRGGIVDITGYSSKLISNASYDGHIGRLVSIAVDGGFKAGLMEYSASENAIIWFTPNLIRTKTGLPKASYRGLFIPEDTVHKLIDIFNHSSLVTKAEKHLIFQLAAGMSLRTAADADNLKIETKRTQLKSICSKLQCNGQTDLLRHILGQLTYLLSLTDMRNNRSAELSEFTKEFLPSDTKIIEHRLPNDRIIRVLERGPAKGKTVMIIHGMMWPLLLNSPLSVLKSKNIRIIVPIRSGYIDKEDAESLYRKVDLISESLHDIAHYQRNFLREDITIIGASYGGMLALQYAKLFPKLVSELIVLSITPAMPSTINKNFLGRLFGGLKSLSNKPGIFRYIAWQFKKYYAEEKTVKPILQKIYGSSKTDFDLIEGKSGISPMYPWFVDLFQKSIAGIAEDFKFALNDIEKLSKNLSVKTLFIHGRHDPITEADVIENYVKMMENSEIEIIENAGHFLFNTHSYQLWDIIQNKTKVK